MSMSIPYFFEPVVLIRDRVIVTDPGGMDGLKKDVSADRIEVARSMVRNRRPAPTREVGRARYGSWRSLSSGRRRASG